MLVATDVASRGIHVEDITHVFNYDFPQDPENYVHRIGRTARAGKKGKAFSLACEEYVFYLEPLEKMLDYKIPLVWPQDEWFIEDKAGHVSTSKKRGLKRPPKKSGGMSGRPRKRVQNVKKNTPPGTFFGLGSEEDQDAKLPLKQARSKRKNKKTPIKKKEVGSK